MLEYWNIHLFILTFSSNAAVPLGVLGNNQ
jgi:hypothetical protein